MRRTVLIVLASVATWLHPHLALAQQQARTLAESGTKPFRLAISPDPLFLPAVRYDTGDTDFTVALGDVTGDGRLDIVTPNARASTVTVRSGPGDGTFPLQTDYATAADPIGITLADLNRDGRLDVVTANGTSDNVSVLLNDGSGFSSHVEYSVGAYPLSVGVGDLNGDGRPDIVAGNYADGSGSGTTISILVNQGGGTFGSRTDLGGFRGPHVASVRDLNGDHDLDLVIANAPCCVASNVSVVLGNGDGTFGSPVGYPVGRCPQSAVVADFNHDGHLDLAVSNHCEETISVLLGAGDGTFGPTASYTTGPGPEHVDGGDFDGDGNIDLVTADQYSGNPYIASVLLGHGDGTFGDRSDYDVGDMPYYVAVGDLNGDHTPDAVTANPNSSSVSVLLNAGRPGCSATSVSLDFAPNSLNLRSSGRWVTAVLEPQPPATPSDIDVVSIHLNGTVAVDPSAPTSIGDADLDGRPDLTVKFDRTAAAATLDEGNEVEVEITGEMGSGCFEATEAIRVIRTNVGPSNASTGLQTGGANAITPRIQTGAVELSLQGLQTNANRNLTVGFTLPDARPATLVAYDVFGREVGRREVGSLGTGRHVATLDEQAALPTGIYLVRLVHGDHGVTARVAVIR